MFQLESVTNAAVPRNSHGVALMRRIVAVVALLTLFVMHLGESRTQAGAPLRCEIQDAPTFETKVSNGTAYFAANGKLLAADLFTCDVSWTWTPDYDVIWLTVSERAVFAIDDVRGEERGSRITALSTARGEAMWSAPVDFSASTAYL